MKPLGALKKVLQFPVLKLLLKDDVYNLIVCSDETILCFGLGAQIPPPPPLIFDFLKDNWGGGEFFFFF